MIVVHSGRVDDSGDTGGNAVVHVQDDGPADVCAGGNAADQQRAVGARGRAVDETPARGTSRSDVGRVRRNGFADNNAGRIFRADVADRERVREQVARLSAGHAVVLDDFQIGGVRKRVGVRRGIVSGRRVRAVGVIVIDAGGVRDLRDARGNSGIDV